MGALARMKELFPMPRPQTRAEVTRVGLARFVSKPPAHLLKLALELEVLRQSAESAPEADREAAREAFRRRLSESWPEVRELIWRSLGRFAGV